MFVYLRVIHNRIFRTEKFVNLHTEADERERLHLKAEIQPLKGSSHVFFGYFGIKIQLLLFIYALPWRNE